MLEEHKKILYKVCRSYCKNPNDRDDLAQEILFQLWRSFGGFDQRVRFSTRMYRIALNVAISFYRRESVRTRHVIPGEEQLLEAAVETGSQPEEIQFLYQWIGELNPLNKAIVLFYLDGPLSENRGRAGHHGDQCGDENRTAKRNVTAGSWSQL